MKTRLTDISIRKLSLPNRGQITVWDENTPGFGIRLSTRSKSFVVMFGEKRRLKTLGRYPVLGLAEARKEARRTLAEYEAGLGYEVSVEIVLFSEVKERFLQDLYLIHI